MRKMISKTSCVLLCLVIVYIKQVLASGVYKPGTGPVHNVLHFSSNDSSPFVLEIQDYSLDFVSTEYYESFNATLVVYDPTLPCPACLNACLREYNNTSLDDLSVVWSKYRGEDIAIAFTANHCRLEFALENIARYRDFLKEELSPSPPNIVAAIELFGYNQGNGFLDQVPRYALPPSANFPVHRSRGSDSMKLLRQGFGCLYSDTIAPNNEGAVSLSEPCQLPSSIVSTGYPKLVMEFSFTESPWRQMYSSFEFLAFRLTGLIAFSLFALWSFATCYRMRFERAQLKDRSNGPDNLQHATSQVFLALGIIRVVDFVISLVRDVGHVWISELYAQLNWIWGYAVAQLAFVLLILYWNAILKSNQISLELGSPTRCGITVMFIGLLLILTTFMCIYVLRVSEYSWVFLFLATGVLAVLAVSESIALLVFGGKIVFTLKSVSKKSTNRVSVISQEVLDKTSQAPVLYITTLVIGCGVMILVTASLAVVTYSSNILKTPDWSYVTLFSVLTGCEICAYCLVAQTVFPAPKCCTRNKNKNDTDRRSYKQHVGNNSKTNRSLDYLRTEDLVKAYSRTSTNDENKIELSHAAKNLSSSQEAEMVTIAVAKHTRHTSSAEFAE